MDAPARRRRQGLCGCFCAGLTRAWVLAGASYVRPDPRIPGAHLAQLPRGVDRVQLQLYQRLLQRHEAHLGAQHLAVCGEALRSRHTACCARPGRGACRTASRKRNDIAAGAHPLLSVATAARRCARRGLASLFKLAYERPRLVIALAQRTLARRVDARGARLRRPRCQCFSTQALRMPRLPRAPASRAPPPASHAAPPAARRGTPRPPPFCAPARP